MIYWVTAPAHHSFEDNDLCNKFNLCMESIVKSRPNMRCIKIKECWSDADSNLVTRNGHFTEIGKGVYWKAIDTSVEFNVEKRKHFLLKTKSAHSMKGETPGRKHNQHGKDPMFNFFRRNHHHSESNDAFHWRRPAGESSHHKWHDHSDNCYLLPRLRR